MYLSFDRNMKQYESSHWLLAFLYSIAAVIITTLLLTPVVLQTFTNDTMVTVPWYQVIVYGYHGFIACFLYVAIIWFNRAAHLIKLCFWTIGLWMTLLFFDSWIFGDCGISITDKNFFHISMVTIAAALVYLLYKSYKRSNNLLPLIPLFTAVLVYVDGRYFGVVISFTDMIRNMVM